MQRSKNLAMMFLLGAVLVGGALGFTADRVWTRDAWCKDPRASQELLYDRLELDPKQRAAFDSGLSSSLQMRLSRPDCVSSVVAAV